MKPTPKTLDDIQTCVYSACKGEPCVYPSGVVLYLMHRAAARMYKEGYTADHLVGLFQDIVYSAYEDHTAGARKRSIKHMTDKAGFLPSDLWVSRVYNMTRYALPAQDATKKLPENLAAQADLFQLTLEEPYGGYNSTIKFKCSEGHEFGMTGQMLYYYANSERHPCKVCRDKKDTGPSKPRPHTETKWKYRSAEQGFHVARLLGHPNTWEFGCDYCSAVSQRSAGNFSGYKRCAECNDNAGDADTVWVAEDIEPLDHAFVWIGRKPRFIEALGDKVHVHPVFLHTNIKKPSEWFVREKEKVSGADNSRYTRYARDDYGNPIYRDIVRHDLAGVAWETGVQHWITDDQTRALTSNKRSDAVLMLDTAIDFLSGRIAGTPYTDKTNRLYVLNTQHNKDFLDWDEEGKPTYAWKPDMNSPLAKAFIQIGEKK